MVDVMIILTAIGRNNHKVNYASGGVTSLFGRLNDVAVTAEFRIAVLTVVG